MTAPVIFSGIQPTGRKHLGNYIGAIRQYVEGQERGEPAIFCIVDLHALSVAFDPADLRERLYDTTAILLAAGLDPERCILFRQSDVLEHSRADLAALGGHLARRPQPHAPVQGQVGEAARAGLGGALLLPGADGRRRARLQGDRGAGRRRPAPARRADAGDRPPLQRALRRDAGRPRAPHPRGRRADHGPAAAGAEDVDHRLDRGRDDLRARRAATRSARSSAAPSPTPGREIVRAPDKPGVEQPDRSAGRRPRRRAGGDRGASSKEAATAT